MSSLEQTLGLPFRLASHLWPNTHETHTIAAIKGECRRNAIDEQGKEFDVEGAHDFTKLRRRSSTRSSMRQSAQIGAWYADADGSSRATDKRQRHRAQHDPEPKARQLFPGPASADGCSLRCPRIPPRWRGETGGE